MTQPLAADTSAQLEPELIAALRSLSPARRLMLARDMNWMTDWLAMAGIGRRLTSAGQRELGLELALQRLTPEQRRQGASLLQALDLAPTPADSLDLAVRVAATFDALAIPYLIIGSAASVAHGEYRLTRNLDVLIDLALPNLGEFVDGLWASCTFLPGDIADALGQLDEAREDRRRRARFWAYDRATGFPIDIYLSAGHPFEVGQFQRACVIKIPGAAGGTLRLASAEDTVLAKLEWHRLAPADRQWRDVQAILRVQADLLDTTYMRQWAAELGLADRLRLALRGQPPPRPGDEPR